MARTGAPTRHEGALGGQCAPSGAGPLDLDQPAMLGRPPGSAAGTAAPYACGAAWFRAISLKKPESMSSVRRLNFQPWAVLTTTLRL